MRMDGDEQSKNVGRKEEDRPDACRRRTSKKRKEDENEKERDVQS